MAGSYVPWITVTSGSIGTGNGLVGLSVSPNPNSTPRSGNVLIAGDLFTVVQDGKPCSPALSAYSASYGAPGGNGSVDILMNAPDCPWAVSSGASWLTISSAANGTGSATVSFRVAANTSTASRSGNMTIAGRTYTVTQAGVGCLYTLSAASAPSPYGGGSGSVNVTAQPGCAWSASSSRPWITINSGSSGSGSGQVTYSVGANPDSVARSGTLTIAGQTFTINQAAAPCSYSVAASSTSFSGIGGSGSVNVTAGTGCTWAGSSPTLWITVTSGSGTTGSGTLNFVVAANPNSVARSGTLTVAGQTVTINQAGTPCAYVLSAASGSFPASGGSGSFNLTAGIDCSSTATASATWITIASVPTAIGSRTIQFSVAANPAATPRSGSVSVAGQSYGITQAGVGCSYTLSAPSASAPAAGGNATVSVTAPVGCSWTASPNASWLTIVSGASGNGNGTVTYSVAANNTPALRSGTLTVAGQLFNVNQPAETVAPPTPTGLNALPASCSEINVAWAAVTDQGGSGLRGYRVYRNGVFVREVLTPSTSTTDSGLAGATTYNYTVEALDNVGNRSAQSAAVSATTPTCPPPPTDWAGRFGGAAGENGQAVAADAAGNMVVGGYFSGTIDFGRGPLSAGTTYAFFLAKFGPDGVCAWAKRFSVSATPFAVKAIAIASNGDVIMAGYFSGTTSFGGTSLASAGDADIFLVRFDAQGQHLWSRSFGAADTDMANALSLDRSGNILIAGYFSGLVSLGGQSLGAAWTGMHAFVAKYSSTGTHLWSKDFVCAADNTATGVAADSAGNVLLTGHFGGSINLGGAELPADGISGTDVFVAKFTAAGAHVWSRRAGGAYADLAAGIAVDSGDNAIITGIYYYRSNFGGTNFNNSGTFDIFLAKYSSTGAHVWSRSVGSSSIDGVNGVAVDPNDNIIITGYYQGTANFGGSELLNKGGYDIFLAKYNSGGAHAWSQRFGEGGTDVAYGVATDASGNVVLTGNFQGTVTFGSRTLSSAGDFDAFLHRRGP